MKTTTIISAALLAANSLCGADQASVTVTIQDGSVVKGELCSESFNGSTAFSTPMSLSAEFVKELTFTDTNGTSMAVLTNGDHFAFCLTDASVKVNSFLGELSIPVTKIRKMILTAKTVAENDVGLVFTCSFEGKESIPGKINNAKFVDGKVGQALYVQRGLSACEVNLPEGTIGPKGCIEFWAAMIEGKTEFSTGGDPRFYSLYDSEKNYVGAFEYASNTGTGNSGIWACLPQGYTYSSEECNSKMPYSSVFHGKPYEGWHHYALIWNCDGLSLPAARGRAIAILIDGRIATPYTKGGNSEESIKKLQHITTLAIPMNLNGPSYNNKSSFLLDELKIWNYDKTPEVED